MYEQLAEIAYLAAMTVQAGPGYPPWTELSEEVRGIWVEAVTVAYDGIIGVR